MSYVPPIGAAVRMVASEKTTNWTRIDVGRCGTIKGHSAYSWTHEAGPRVLVLVAFDKPERWDGAAGLVSFACPCQVEPV